MPNGVVPNPFEEELRRLNILTQRPSQQSPGGFPIIRPEGRPRTPQVQPISPVPGLPPSANPILDIINQPIPGLPTPGLENVPSFNPALLEQISTLLGPSGLSPQQQQVIDILKQVGAEQGAAGVARAQSGAMRRGITGSSTEQFGLAQAEQAGIRATQESLAPVLTQFANQQELRRQALAGIFADIGKQDVLNQRESIFRLTDRLVAAGQFDISNLVKLREIGLNLIQQELESLRRTGLAEKELAQQKELKMRELENQLDQIKAKAQSLRPQELEYSFAPGGGYGARPTPPTPGLVR